MKIIDADFPSDDTTVALSKMTIEYCQDLDCCQSEGDFPDAQQILTITCDDGGGGKFLRINTNKAGWSVSDIDEFVEILTDYKNRLKCD